MAGGTFDGLKRKKNILVNIKGIKLHLFGH